MMKAPSFIILLAFLVNSIGPMPVYAQNFILPAPGIMVHLSPPLDPPMLKGIKVHPDNPFRFDFILDVGDGSKPSLQIEATQLIKYFLASLTIPEKDLWVNLSPYEKDRIIPQSFGLTEMGRDLLAEDYMLKQITASLIYPEDKIGKKFWKRIYEEATKKFGTTNIPVNTFNKVWIIPEKAVVYENAKAGTAYVVESKLKVMLEQDYLSMSKHADVGVTDGSEASQIIREIIIPELAREVNEGKNFTQLRQVYNSLILATWYKKKIKNSLLSQVYADKKKIAGLSSPNALIGDPQHIYQQYLKAFKKGVYNYIKEDIDPATQETITKKYFSGGVDFAMISHTSLGMDEIIKNVDDRILRAALSQKHHETFLISENTTPLPSGVVTPRAVKQDDNKIGVPDLPSGFKRTSAGLLVPVRKPVSDNPMKKQAQLEVEGIMPMIAQGIKEEDFKNLLLLWDLLQTTEQKKAVEDILTYLKGQLDQAPVNRSFNIHSLAWREHVYELMERMGLYKDGISIYTVLRLIKESPGDELQTVCRKFLNYWADNLGKLSERSWGVYLEILERLPYESNEERISTDLPPNMTFGVELEMAWLDSNSADTVNKRLTASLKRRLEDALNGLFSGWRVKMDDQNLEINTPTLTNDRRGRRMLQEGIDVVQEIINDMKKQYAVKNLKLATGMHIHVGMIGADLLSVEPAVMFIGKALEYFWAILSQPGSILPVSMPVSALQKEGSTGKNSTFIYFSNHDTFAFNALTTQTWDDKDNLAKIIASMGVAGQVVSTAVENPEKFDLSHWARPVLEGAAYTEAIGQDLRDGLDRLYEGNTNGKIGFLKLLLSRGWRPKLVTPESLLRDKPNDKRKEILGDLFLTYAYRDPIEWSKLLNRLLKQRLIEADWIIPYRQVEQSDGKYVLLIENGHVLIRDNLTNQVVMTSHERQIARFKSLSGGKYLAVAYTQGGWGIFNVETGGYQEKGPGIVNYFNEICGGQYLVASYSGVGNWRLLNVETMELLGKENRHQVHDYNEVLGGKYLAVFYEQGDGWRILNAKTGKSIGNPGRQDIRNFQEISGGKYLALAFTQGGWGILNVKTGEYKEYDPKEMVSYFQGTSDGQYLALAYMRGGLGILNLETDEFTKKVSGLHIFNSKETSGGKYLTASYTEGGWGILNIKTCEFIGEEGLRISAYQEISGGKYWALAYKQGGWEIFNSKTGEYKKKGRQSIRDFKEISGGKYLAVAYTQGGWGVLNVETDEFIEGDSHQGDNYFRSIPGGKYLVVGLEGREVLNLETGKFEKNGSFSYEISGGKYLMMISPQSFRGILNVKTNKFITQSGQRDISYYMEIPGDRYLAVEFSRGGWGIVDVNTGEYKQKGLQKVSHFNAILGGQYLEVAYSEENGYNILNIETGKFIGDNGLQDIRYPKKIPGGQYLSVEYIQGGWGIFDAKTNEFVVPKINQRVPIEEYFKEEFIAGNRRYTANGLEFRSIADILGADRADAAMKANQRGGIDLTPAHMNVEIKNDTIDTFKFNLDPAMLRQLQNASGFTPVIINIQPIINVTAFLEA